MYLLDTNICIHYLNGQYDLNQKIRKVGFTNCYISELTILELLYGVANSNSSRKDENSLKLRRFETDFINQTILIRSSFEIFAQQKTQLRQAGTPISDFDLLIGCTALMKDFTMVTRNVREMQRIAGLKIENWIA